MKILFTHSLGTYTHPNSKQRNTRKMHLTTDVEGGCKPSDFPKKIGILLFFVCTINWNKYFRATNSQRMCRSKHFYSSSERCPFPHMWNAGCKPRDFLKKNRHPSVLLYLEFLPLSANNDYRITIFICISKVRTSVTQSFNHSREHHKWDITTSLWNNLYW